MLDLDSLEAKAKAVDQGVLLFDGAKLYADTALSLIRELREARAGLEYVRGYVESLIENGEAVHAVGLLRDIDGFLAEKGESHA